MTKQVPRQPLENEAAKVLGPRIKELRESRGWSQSALARQLQISKSMIAKYEGGVHVPPLAVLERLANVFAVTTDSLLGRDVRDPRLLHCLREVERMDQQSRLLVTDAIEGIVQAYRMLFVHGVAGKQEGG